MIVNEIICSGGHLDGFFHFLGAFKAIYENKTNIKMDIKHYLGTSSGAFLLFCMYIGYTPAELHNIIKKIPIKKLGIENGKNFLFLFDKFGILSTDTFKKIFGFFLEHKGYSKDSTFQDLFSRLKICLSFTTFCMNDQKVKLLNYVFTPSLRVSEALCMTMCIPLYMQPILYDSCYYVDSALVTNFPFEFHQYDNYLGFNLKHPIKCNQNFDFWSYVKTLTQSILREVESMKDLEVDEKNVLQFEVSIRYKFDICEEELNKMIENGYKLIQTKFANKYKLFLEKK